ncbi:hypothetical protein [Streptomyces beijiangensis]|uniref:Uncharacterized protein n=1 Tax=Streptomyces beijiangensis TaxID=163361 RepID=A0A939FDZ2_9ACTN|nr:hypothetical protein [Streptomyces beijiangensis]MBO0515652.1 hypothetical protein [Streptomyces beijiangensis]
MSDAVLRSSGPGPGAVCAVQGESAFVRWLAEQRTEEPHFGDLKRSDALTALRTAQDAPE